MARRLRVQHWIACLESRVDPPVGVNNLYNLFHVGYTHFVPAEAEFPWSLSRLDMFTRFVAGKGTAEFEAEVTWWDAPEGRRQMNIFGPLRISFRRGEPVRDVVFRFRNVPIEGVGRYRIQLRCVKPLRKRPLATEFITLERSP